MTDLATRARLLFHELVQLPAAQRERALAQLAQQDYALHTAVRALLEADGEAVPILDRSPASLIAGHRQAGDPGECDPGARDPADDDRIGVRLGAWRLDRAIARGGMGAVYEASRADGQYQQRVALKCMRAGLVSPELVEAFRVERNQLARLEHPGIALLIDSGVEDDGRPWWAMRYVDGVAIDRWCDEHRVPIAQRVDLLIQAARALAYAHAHGVPHRDIKPANLLVTADGQAHLVDFGPSATFETLSGAHRARLGPTSDYLAPEALEHAVTGPVTDLYALGVITYRLLCGEGPAPSPVDPSIPAASARPAEPMERRVANAPQRLAHARGESSVAALARRLRGDLSAIALKAVAPRPQDRYASVDEFADDLRRWREHRPVHAYRAGAWTRLRKGLRRHRAAAAMAALLALVISAAVVVPLWQNRVARSHAEASEAVSDLFASTLGTATLAGLGSTPFSSQTLLAKIETELRRRDLRRHPDVFADGLATLARAQATVGDYPRAARLADEAQRVLGDAEDANGYVAATRVSMLNLRARYAEAERLARTRMAELADRDDDPTHREKVTFGVELARAQWGLGDTRGALRIIDDALAQARDLRSDNAEMIAQLLIQRGDFRGRLLRYREARADLESAISMMERVNPILADDGLEQWVALSLTVDNAPDLARAERLLRHRQATLGERHSKTGRAWILLGLAQMINNRKVVGRQQMLTGQALIEAAYGREHPEYAMTLLPLSNALSGQQRDNVAPLREALRITERTLGPRHESTLQVRRSLASRLSDQPSNLTRPSDHLEAERLFRENIEIKRRAGLPAPMETLFLGHSLLIHGKRADLAQAAALFEQARRDAALYYRPDDRYPLTANQFWYQARYLMGHRAEADRGFARNIDTRIGKPGLTSNLTVHDSFIYRALYAYENCRTSEAETLLKQAVESDTRAFGTDHFTLRDAQGYLLNLRKHGRMVNTTGGQLIPAYELDEANRRAQACSRSRGM